MIWISFKKWNHRAGSMFIWDRVYRNGYRWTPFVVGRPRYLAHPPAEANMREAILETFMDAYARNRGGFRDIIRN